MKNSTVLTHLFEPYTNEDNTWISSGLTLRKWIGLLGMSLPPLLVFSLYLSNNVNHTLESISHYYFTRVGSIFVLIIGVIGIFLIVYKGYALIDSLISVLAGVAALVVVLFPTSNLSEVCQDADMLYAVTILQEWPFQEKLHYIAAAVFLGCLAYMSLFLFTKTHPNGKKTTNKLWRNGIYIFFGSLMVVALLVIFAGFSNIIDKVWFKEHCMTFWMEFVAVESFGIAWLVKGDTISLLRDSKDKS